jgi:hypothetical protein
MVLKKVRFVSRYLPVVQLVSDQIGRKVYVGWIQVKSRYFTSMHLVGCCICAAFIMKLFRAFLSVFLQHQTPDRILRCFHQIPFYVLLRMHKARQRNKK